MAKFHQLQCMRSFVAVAEARNFTRAADALQISAASISEHVTSLERHLRASLIQRTTRSMRLTDEGNVYLALCRDVLDRIAEAEEHLSPGKTTPSLRGRLTVEMSEGVDAFLLDAICAFQEVHPHVSIRTVRSQHQFDATPGGADVAIRSAPPQAAEMGGVVSRTLGKSRTTFLASPGYLKRHGCPKNPDALLEHRCIGYIDPTTGRLWEWFFGSSKGEPFMLDVPCSLAMMQGALRRHAAAKGLGIINDLAHFVDPWLSDGSLVQSWKIGRCPNRSATSSAIATVIVPRALQPSSPTSSNGLPRMGTARSPPEDRSPRCLRRAAFPKPVPVLAHLVAGDGANLSARSQ